MANSNNRQKEGSYIFFWLIATVMIVLSNVAFQQYALYNLEVDRLELGVDRLTSEYTKSLMLESIIEIKNTLVISHMAMTAQKNVLEGLEYVLARQYNTADNVTGDAIKNLTERNRVLSALIDEVTNVSAQLAYTAPNLADYEEAVLRETKLLNELKLEAIEKGGFVRSIGFLIIAHALFLIIYALYLSQVGTLKSGELKYMWRLKAGGTIQVLLGFLTIFMKLEEYKRSIILLYVMCFILAVSVFLVVFSITKRMASKRENVDEKP